MFVDKFCFTRQLIFLSLYIYQLLKQYTKALAGV